MIRYRMKFFLLGLGLLLIGPFSIGQNRILVDEEVSDWQGINPLYIDGVGDGVGLDFQNFWIHSDAEYLFLRISLGSEINLQDGNGIRLHIDIDNDVQTGTAIGGIGADLSYYFGERRGEFGLAAQQQISHSDIGLVTSPTVSSNEFEIAIRRDAVLSGQPIFPGNSISIFWEEAATGGDVMPEQAGGLGFTFDNSPTGDFPEYSITKTDTSFLRVLSYNVLSDGPWDNPSGPAFDRVLAALSPDIIGFQEIYNHSSQQTSDRVATILQQAYTGPWYHSGLGPDIIVVSKYPIISSFPIGNNGAFLIDLGDREMLFIVAHPPCCNNNTGRQAEIDAIMAFVRDAKSGVGALTLFEETPMVIVGDMNLVGFSEQQATLISGTINDNTRYGPDFAPDWDGSIFEDAKPPTTGMPMTFTWYQESSSFSPGRLDYIVYSGSVMALQNTFSFFTPALSSSVLTQFGLQQDDGSIASDHLPIVADFLLPMTTAIYGSSKNPGTSFDWFPNPARETGTVSLQVKEKSSIYIKLTDITGRVALEMDQGEKAPGEYKVELALAGLASGVYVCSVRIGKFRMWKKVTVSN